MTADDLDGEYEITFVHPETGSISARAQDDAPLFDVALESGIELGYGCYDGTCLNCLGRLREGEVVHAKEPVALTPDLLEDGFVLLCVAKATSHCTIELGSHLREEAYPSLWGE